MDSNDDTVYTCTCVTGYEGSNCETSEYMFVYLFCVIERTKPLMKMNRYTIFLYLF